MAINHIIEAQKALKLHDESDNYNYGTSAIGHALIAIYNLLCDRLEHTTPAGWIAAASSALDAHD